jgi:hypothetical protein
MIQQDSETTLKGKAEVEQPVYEFEVPRLDLAGQQLRDLGGTLIEPFDGEFALLHSFRSNPPKSRTFRLGVIVHRQWKGE